MRSRERPVLPPTAAFRSIQKGQPLRAAARRHTIRTRSDPARHRPVPKIVFDRADARTVHIYA